VVVTVADMVIVEIAMTVVEKAALKREKINC
jgi:hypothetical protein